MKLSVHRRSSLWSILVLLSSYVIFAQAESALPNPEDEPKSENASKFSRLLSAKAGSLKFSSISTTGEKIPFISIADIVPIAATAAAPKASASMSVSSSFSTSSSKSNSLIPQQSSSGSLGDHTDMILQSYRAPLYEFSERPKLTSTETSMAVSSSESNSTDNNIDQVGILRRPVSRRGPVSVLQQITTGNKLNLTPLFAEPNLDEKEQELSEAATNNYPNYSEDSSTIAASVLPTTTFQPSSSASNETDEYYEEEDEVSSTTDQPSTTTTTTTTTTTVRPVSPRGRSRNRGVVLQDATTTTTKRPSTTKPTTTTPIPLTTTSTPKDDTFHDNLVFVNPRRNVKEINLAPRFDDRFIFPDFEDSPASLVTAESSQPARVNVRPASSGKEYEYEYIYYYYDDDDDDNSTSTTTTARPAPAPAATTRSSKVEAIGIKGTETFTPEKAPAKFSPPVDSASNHLDRSRGTKSFETEQPVYSTVDQSSFAPPVRQQQQTFPEYTTQDDYYQPQAAPQPEDYPESTRTNTRPVVLKQSNLVQEPATTLPPPTRPAPITNEEVVVQQAPKSRFRTKPNFDSPPANQFAPAPIPVEVVADSPQVEPRPVYKELTSRRIPQRRPEIAASPQDAAAVVQDSPQENVRLPGRTRFPPRVTPTAAHEEVLPIQQQVVQEPVRQYHQEQVHVLPQPVLPVYYETVPQQYDIPATTLPPRFLDPEQEAKAKENYARQKSINDLYALTRLHQLAINTRVPNRKEFEPAHAPPASSHKSIPPQVSGGFISSEPVERPDDYEEPRTYLPTTTTTAAPTTTTDSPTTLAEVTPEVPARATLPTRNRGFRGRTRPTGSPSTTEAVARQPVPANRFAGRRRNFAQQDGEAVGTADPVTSASPQTTPVRAPGRNRFRLRTSTTARPTEVYEPAVPSPSVSANVDTEQETPRPPRRQRPGFVNRRKQAQQQQEAPDVPEAPIGTSAPPTTEKRRVTAGRSRPIVGRPLKSRTSTSAPEPVEFEEIVHPTEPVYPSPEAVQEQEPVVSQKVTVSSSSTVSESTPEVPKRGSSAVLGRLRNRTKPGAVAPTQAATSTTPAPTSPVTERKPSRLNGILNRRKNGPVAEAAPTNVVTQTVVNDESADHNHAVEDVVTPKGGVIVAVSSVVSESSEIGDPEEDVPATPASILNRLKSKRKPGSLFRNRTEQQ